MGERTRKAPQMQEAEKGIPHSRPVWWWTIPRGSSELQWIPAWTQARQLNNRQSIVTIQIIDGIPRPVMFHTDIQYLKERLEHNQMDAIMADFVRWLRDPTIQGKSAYARKWGQVVENSKRDNQKDSRGDNRKG